MIDIHTHILAAFDDGARTLEESVRMARMSYECGVDTLFVTPHFNSNGFVDQHYKDRFFQAIKELDEAIRHKQIPVRLLSGMEVFAGEELPDLLSRGSIITLNYSRYLLLEFDFQKDLALMDFLLNELTQQGYLPIIAHPERYPYVQKDPDMLKRWIRMGCSLQVNKGSIMGNFGKRARKTAKYLLKYRWVSFIASDAHSPEVRTPDLSGAYHYVCSHYTKEYAEVLFEENPRRVIEDKALMKGMVNI